LQNLLEHAPAANKSDYKESVDSIVGIARMHNTKNLSKSPKKVTYKPLQQHTVHLRVFSWWTTHPLVQKIIMKVPN